MRNLFIGIVLLLWLLLGYKMCTDYNNCCSNPQIVEPSAVKAPPTTPKSTRPCPKIVCFEKSDCNPIFCDNWSDFRDSLINQMIDGQKLVITGYYSPSEANSSTFGNLGICRADTIRRTILSHHSTTNIEIAGRLRVGQSSNSQAFSCERIGFKIVSEGESVRNSTLIYFPYNSTNKLSDSGVESYLKQVASDLISSGNKVRLTGHTDSHGNNVYNMNLGLNRANIIKNYLIEQNVPSSQIIALSKGENQPVASNETKVGRAKNRRTELQIIK